MDANRRKTFMGISAAAGAGSALVLASGTARSETVTGANAVSYKASDVAATRTVQDKLREEVSLEDFGAVGDGVTDDRLAVDRAIQHVATFGGGRINVGPKTYYLNDTVFIPDGVSIEFVGISRLSSFHSRSHGAAAFRYVRGGGNATYLTFRNIIFAEKGYLKAAGGAGIFFWGADKVKHDSQLNCYECIFYGYDNAVWTRFTGQARFQECSYYLNNICHRMDRDASFHMFANCLALNNGQWIDADDSRGLPANEYVSDGVSNTIVIEGCVSVGSARGDVFINGWQSVYIAKGGCDGGAGVGGAAMHLKNVFDFSIDAMYFSSSSKNNVRAGLYLEDSLRGQIRGCSFVSCDIGLLQTGPSPASIAAIGDTSSKLVIDGNTFRDNKTSDLATLGYLRASKIVNNHFGSGQSVNHPVPNFTGPSRTGASFELYINSATCAKNIVTCNTFTGSEYPISSGSGSHVGNNLFDAD